MASESILSLNRTNGIGSTSLGSPFNPLPQNAPGASAAIGHTLENSIPLSIFPVATDKFCICFCGLPGRGKTHIARRLGRYLEFFHAIPVQVFHVADYRRKLFGDYHAADWFDPSNAEACHLRDSCQNAATVDTVEFLNKNTNGVAIIDSTNATSARRQKLISMIRTTGAKIMWIEVSNEDEAYLAKQYLSIITHSPDYVGVHNAEAYSDYRQRVDKYRSIFEPIDHPRGDSEIQNQESKWSYMKCDHAKQYFVVNNVKGYLMQKVVNFIMNMRTTSHAFFLTRHGQSEYNDLGRIGGDSGLTEHGLRYAEKLAEFASQYIVKDAQGNDVPARLWTSTMRRTKETAQFIPHNKILIKSESDPNIEYEWVQMRPRAWHHLDELFAGSCDGMTYEEIEEQFPEEWSRRNVDKLAYRYPRGESYLDVIARLEPIIIEMERHQENLLIVAHQGILRIIYAFYMGLSRAEAPYVSIPLNTVVQVIPTAYKCQEQRHRLYIPAKALPCDGQGEKHGKPINEDPQSH